MFRRLLSCSRRRGTGKAAAIGCLFLGMLPVTGVAEESGHADPSDGRTVAGRFALIDPDSPETLRGAVTGTSDLAEIPLDNRTIIVRGQAGQAMRESALD